MRKLNIFMIALIALILTGCSKVDFTKTNTHTLTDLSYEVPEVFEVINTDYTSGYGSEYDANSVGYHFSDKKHSCYLYLAQYNYEYSNIKEMVKMSLSTDNDSVYMQKDINNTTWGYGTNNNNYVYLANHNGKGYIVTYDDMQECSGVKDIIENSLRFN